MLEFDTGVGRCEVPIGLGVSGIAIVLPGGDFLDQGLFVGNASVEALGRQDAEFGFGEIEPAAVLGGVVPFEALDQAPGLGGRKGLIEGSLAVDVEIVLDQDDGLGVGKVSIGEVFEDVSVIDRGVAVRDLDVAPAFERREQHKEIGGAVALVLVIMTGRAPRFHRHRHAGLGDELL